MSIFDERVEELKERRSEALNGIVSSQQSINEIAVDDNNVNRYLSGENENDAGVLKLLSLYQQERICEKDISYFIEDLTKSNVEAKINSDISNIMNSSESALIYYNFHLYNRKN